MPLLLLGGGGGDNDDDDEGGTMLVMLHRQLKGGAANLVAEMLCRIVVVPPLETQNAGASSSDVRLYFESVDEKALKPEFAAKVKEWRKLVAQQGGATIVSGVEQGYVVLSAEEHTGCTRVHMAFEGKYDCGALQEAVGVKLLKRCFAPLKAAQITYERCEEIDELRRRHFVAMMNSLPVPSAAERAMIDASLALDNGKFQQLPRFAEEVPHRAHILRRRHIRRVAVGEGLRRHRRIH